MTFSCPNYNYNTGQCRKVKADCVPGRPGCVLPKSIKFSDDLETRLKKAEERAKQSKGSS